MKKIRLWTLGNLEHMILPTKSMIDTLRGKIQDMKDSGEDEVDLIWGPDLKLSVYSIDGPVEDYIVEDGKLTLVG